MGDPYEDVELSRIFLTQIFPDADWEIDHMERTPERFVAMLQTLGATRDSGFNFTTFENIDNVNEMVIQENIEFASLCAHHIIPFVGKAHIAYIPARRLAGLSKLARAVKWLATGLWTQESLTNEIVEYLDDQLHPLGVGIVMTAEHQCMTLRGVQARGTKTTTSAMRGVFLDPQKHAREEFLSLVHRNGS